jgi:hypothetical protein
MAEPQWGVEVNETAIYQSGPVALWWGIYRHQILEPGGATLTTITPCEMGDVVFVHRESRKSAEWLRNLILSKGAPKLAATVRTLAAAMRAGAEEVGRP